MAKVRKPCAFENLNTITTLKFNVVIVRSPRFIKSYERPFMVTICNLLFRTRNLCCNINAIVSHP